MKKKFLFLLVCIGTFSSQPLHGAVEYALALVAGGGYVVLRVAEWGLNKLFSYAPAPVPAPVPQQTIVNNINVSGNSQVTLTNPALVPPVPAAASEGKNILALVDRLVNLPLSSYGKTTLLLAGTGYLYLLYTVRRMQNYLSSTRCISLWFSEQELNKLLLLEPKTMHELLIQEFMSSYQVNDQKSLKDGIVAFMHDLEMELACLTAYKKITQGIDTASGFTARCGAACGSVLKTVIPVSGLAMAVAPSTKLANIFFIDAHLQEKIQERISRIHYYKNIFLQSTIIL